MEAVSKLELSGILYPPCPTNFGNAIPQGAALAPGAGGANAAQLAAMQVRAHAATSCTLDFSLQARATIESMWLLESALLSCMVSAACSKVYTLCRFSEESHRAKRFSSVHVPIPEAIQ